MNFNLLFFLVILLPLLGCSKDSVNDKSEQKDDVEIVRFDLDEKISFVFEDFGKEDSDRVMDLWKKYLIEIKKFIPDDLITGKTIYSVIKTDDGGGVTSFSKKTVKLDPRCSDAVIIHELVHVLVGKYAFNGVDFLEEGRATAISTMITSKFKLKMWHSFEKILLSQSLAQLVIPGPHVGYSSFFPLMPIRYMKSGDFWIKAENQHPGFIKEFTSLSKSVIDTTKNEHFFCSYDVVKLISMIDKKIANDFDKSTLFAGSYKEVPVTYFYLHFDTLDTKNTSVKIVLCSTIRQGEGFETPFDAKVFIRLTNPSSGLSWEDTIITKNGVSEIVLKDFKYGDIRDRIGKSLSYSIYVENMVTKDRDNLTFVWSD